MVYISKEAFNKLPKSAQMAALAYEVGKTALVAGKYVKKAYSGKTQAPFGMGYLKNKPKTKFQPTSKISLSYKNKPKAKYNTTGAAVSGVKAQNKKKPDNYAVRGSIIRTENGGVSSATTLQSLYLGHGLAIQQVARGVCRAIVKQLFSQAGVTFSNWSDGAAFGGKIGVYYVENPAITTPSLGGFELTFATSDSYLTIAANLLSQLITSWVQGYDYELQRLYLVDTSNTVAMTVAQMMAKQIDLDIFFKSRLAIQNRTLSQAGDADVNDVDNNPLVGKVYGSPLTWTNTVIPKDRTTGNMANSYTAGRETGVITVKSIDTNTTALQKPPPCWFFNFKKESKLIVQPGNITNNYLSWEVKGIKFNTLFKKMGNAFTSNTEMAVDFGSVALLGVEKMLDPLRSSGSGGSISVGYEINQEYHIACNYKKFVPSTPILEVGANQITSS